MNHFKTDVVMLIAPALQSINLSSVSSSSHIHGFKKVNTVLLFGTQQERDFAEKSLVYIAGFLQLYVTQRDFGTEQATCRGDSV